ncbi:oxidative stress survival, Svf1-like protein [Pisolithus orientalis]|uniref:oxidative stress survival, Svf1-like protein n=1 Tax=Pisolithus orientalis TaxID=936130 RepID=UPI002224D892|nr:oxidative stress survival, Svf1-like protein [Pisolithus orientalis]KAI6025690.1 oxidative stress survival, Svf1-like protein [Pisolithus orientalis]
MLSFFNSSTDAKAPNFHPVSERPDLFGELETKDLEWTCAGGFATETQTFYHFLEDETMIMCQVIHSSIGSPAKSTIPTPKRRFGARIHVSNFTTPPPGLDKRSSRADQFSITCKPSTDPTYPEMYAIRANLSDDLQVSLDVLRPALVPGFKVGSGPNGGFSYFGPNKDKPEGYVVHRFWPRTVANGHFIHKGRAVEAKGVGMMVHAIQGMRPNLVATRWNFAHFQSNAYGGVSAIQMEFTTLETHGRRGPGSGGVTVNIGSLVLGGKLAAITAETKWPDEKQSDDTDIISRAVHSLLENSPGKISATIKVDVGGPTAPKGLVEKVDVLAEIPYVIKTMVNYVAGTKPYIYQWQNRVKLFVRGPDTLIPGLSNGLELEGPLYNEASFIS